MWTVAVLWVLVGQATTAQTQLEARRGVLDLRSMPGALERPIKLRGDWEWFWGAALTPQEIAEHGTGTFRTIPTEIYGPVASDGTQARGVATARLQIRLPRREYYNSFAVKIPYFGSAYRVWINGVEVRRVGTIGTPPDYEDYLPRFIPTETPFVISPGTDSEIEIVINVANFYHRRLRLLDVWVGPLRQIQRMTQVRLIWQGVLFGSLLLLAVYHVILYAMHPSDRAILYFALISLVTALRSGIVGERILVRLWPAMPAELMMKIGFSPVFVLPWLLVLYILALTKDSVFPLLRRVTVALLALSIAILVFSRLPVYDWIFQYGMIPIVVYGLGALGTVLVRRPFEGTRAPLILFLSAVAVAATALNDYARELWSAPTPELFSLGILAFLLLQAYFLASRLNDARLASERLQAESQSFATGLELRIAERTRELQVANAALQALSHQDPLTGVANRRAFEEAIDREWRRCVRNRQEIAVIMVDVDMFKRFNDYYGHPVGDQCLTTVAETLDTQIHRSTDFVARYGGEEFVVLLPETGTASAVRVAERMRLAIEKLSIPHEASTTTDVVTASFGVVAVTASAAMASTELVAKADQALYAAKEAGRNRVVGVDDKTGEYRDHTHFA